MKKIVLSMFTVTALFIGVAVLSQDQDQEVVPKGKGVCKADADKFCKGIRHGGGKVWACLKSHEAELSQACKDHIAVVRENRKGFMDACRDDAKKLCKGQKHGKGKVVTCLKNNQDKLSENCKAYINKN